MKRRIAAFFHVPFEGLGSLDPLIRSAGHLLASYRLWNRPRLPEPGSIDAAILMGGPMGVGDVDRHPWLIDEKDAVRRYIDAGVRIVGICLGAQIVAEALGARVYRAETAEIGWFDVHRDDRFESTVLGGVLPRRFDAFHWHGDAFDCPDGAVPLGSSEACACQGFLWADRVAAFQFHLETTPESARTLIDHGAKDLARGGPYVQNVQEMLEKAERFGKINRLMAHIWATLVS